MEDVFMYLCELIHNPEGIFALVKFGLESGFVLLCNKYICTNANDKTKSTQYFMVTNLENNCLV